MYNFSRLSDKPFVVFRIIKLGPNYHQKEYR